MDDRTAAPSRKRIRRRWERAKRCCWPQCGNDVWFPPYGTLFAVITLCEHHLAMASAHNDLRVFRNRQDEEKARKEAARAARAEQAKHGTIYYLRVGSFIKIGWTSRDLAERMREYPPDSILLAIEPDLGRDAETRRHRKFAVHRTHGAEWYAMATPLMHHIKLLADKHGVPSDIDFCARPVGLKGHVPRKREYVPPYEKPQPENMYWVRPTRQDHGIA